MSAEWTVLFEDESSQPTSVRYLGTSLGSPYCECAWDYTRIDPETRTAWAHLVRADVEWPHTHHTVAPQGLRP